MSLRRPARPAFHLLPEELDDIKDRRKQMSLSDRARLSTFIDAGAGIAWLDLGGVLDATIELDDHSSPERERRPHVRIYYKDAAREVDVITPQVEIIDIIESVRNDAAAVGHPAIAFAIYHWQRVVQANIDFQAID